MESQSESKETTKESILGEMSEILNEMEKLNVSPTTSTAETIKENKTKFLNFLKKMVIDFDELLSSQIRIDLGSKDSKKDDNHYWTYLDKYYKIPSVKFCSEYLQSSTNKNKGMVWIALSIVEKSLNDSINDIYKKNIDKKFYDSQSIITQKKKEILDISFKLNKIYPFDFMKDLYNKYLKFKEKFTAEKEKEGESKKDLDTLGVKLIQEDEEPILKDDLTEEDIMKDGPNFANIFPQIPPNEIPNINNQPFMGEKNLQKNIQLLQGLKIPEGFNKEDLETVKLLEDSTSFLLDIDESNPEFPFGEEVPNMEENINSDRGKKNNTMLNLLKGMGDPLPNRKKPFDKSNFAISRESDFNQCFIDNFYNFKQKKKGSEEESIQNKYDLILNPKKNINYPLDRHFEIKEQLMPDCFSKKDSVTYKKKPIKLTNSILFYLNNIYHKGNYLKFNTRSTKLRPVTIETQNYQCYLCKKKFNLILGIPTEKIYFCSYYLKFVCSNCIDNNYSIIPEFILKSWNFKKFSVSKKAKILLEKWKDKPVIQFKLNDILLKKVEKLREVLLLKRKIHKIFDLMKCEDYLEATKNILGDKIYLITHEHFFSIQDLIDINENILIPKLKVFYERMKEHILTQCVDCHYKGGRCFLCNDENPIYAFDVENVIYCNDCKKIFHRKCSVVHPCIINKEK
ncbi:MAG: hypothetical protein MJ252_12130 [archaeon]|nr:hypothetical protein [archaeon]